jgi:GTPase Era involved in 16S rRNA processing
MVKTCCAIYTGYARQNAKMVLHQLAARVYKEIVVIQKIDSQTNSAVKASQLPDKFDLNPVFETRLNMQNYIRVCCMTFALSSKENNE